VVRCLGIPAPAVTESNGWFSFGAMPPGGAPAFLEIFADRARYVVAPKPDPNFENAVLLVVDPVSIEP
jgi:hypothetical protein